MSATIPPFDQTSANSPGNVVALKHSDCVQLVLFFSSIYNHIRKLETDKCTGNEEKIKP